MADQLIRIGHSPDPDDAFMFYALAEELIPMDGFRVEHVLRDIETLNRWAVDGKLEVTAISVHAYAHLADKYRLLPHGASMGEKYGPMVVVRDGAAIEPAQLPQLRVAIPGTWTSAFLELQARRRPDREPGDRAVRRGPQRGGGRQRRRRSGHPRGPAHLRAAWAS